MSRRALFLGLIVIAFLSATVGFTADNEVGRFQIFQVRAADSTAPYSLLLDTKTGDCWDLKTHLAKFPGKPFLTTYQWVPATKFDTNMEWMKSLVDEKDLIDHMAENPVVKK